MKWLFIIIAAITPIACGAQYITPNNGQLGANIDALYYFNAQHGTYLFHAKKWSYVQHKNEKIQEKEVAVSYRTDFIFNNPSEKLLPAVNHEHDATIRFIRNETEVAIEHVYETLVYKNVWPKIDLVFRVENGALKWEYRLNPAADVSNISVIIDGADEVNAFENTLSVSNSFKLFEHTYPSVYQEIAEKEVQVSWQFRLDGNNVGFEMPNGYDKEAPLIIDPWCTYYGGTDVDEAYGFDVDNLGNSYITGYTYSPDLPTVAGVMDTSYNLDYDGYVVKLDPNGDQIWSTYIGGDGGDYLFGVDVDNSGNVYLSGNGTSNDFPVSGSGVYQSSAGGSYDGYLLKLNASGQFVWGTYYGGTGGDLALSSDLYQDKILISGYTTGMISMGAGSYQSVHGGALDAFAAVFDTTGNLIWHTYYGGINSEDAHDGCFDPSGNVIICGDSYSTNFPVSANAHQGLSNGGRESYIVKFDQNGQRVFSTFYGGMADDDILAVAADHNKIYVGGYTTSNDLLMLGNSIQTSLSTGKDGFYAVFSDTGVLEYSTYFGGDHNDEIIDIHTTENRIGFVFNTRSSDLPSYGVPFDNSLADFFDNYVLLLDTAMEAGYSTYFGEMGSETSAGIRLLDDHTIYIGGFSEGDTIAFGSNIFQAYNVGYSDAFAARFDNIVGVFTGLDEVNDSQLEVYPSPTNAFITIKGGNYGDHYQLMDTNGKLVMRIVDDRQAHDLTAIPAGIYYLVRQSDSKTHKLIKQ